MNKISIGPIGEKLVTVLCGVSVATETIPMCPLSYKVCQSRNC